MNIEPDTIHLPTRSIPLATYTDEGDDFPCCRERVHHDPAPAVSVEVAS